MIRSSLTDAAVATALFNELSFGSELMEDVPCFCCETHLADSPKFDRIWSDQLQRWMPYCNCPRHHLCESHDPAKWLFIRHDHELVEGRVVFVGNKSWPICDACKDSWTRDGIDPEAATLIAL